MSEYIRKRKIDTNECPNIYSLPIYSNIQIYSSHSGLKHLTTLFFGLRQNATNAEVKERWNSLVRVYHLDRGGKDENFHKLQIFYDIIKLCKFFLLTASLIWCMCQQELIATHDILSAANRCIYCNKQMSSTCRIKDIHIQPNIYIKEM